MELKKNDILEDCINRHKPIGMKLNYEGSVSGAGSGAEVGSTTEEQK